MKYSFCHSGLAHLMSAAESQRERGGVSCTTINLLEVKRLSTSSGWLILIV